MAYSESEKEIRAKYRKNRVKALSIELYPTDADIIERLEQVGPKATYIKRLIREDIARSKECN